MGQGRRSGRTVDSAGVTSLVTITPERLTQNLASRLALPVIGDGKGVLRMVEWGYLQGCLGSGKRPSWKSGTR